MTAEILEVKGKQYIQINDISGGVELVDSEFYNSLVARKDLLESRVSDLQNELAEANKTISELALSNARSEEIRANASAAYAEVIKDVQRGKIMDGVNLALNLLLCHPEGLRNYVDVATFDLLTKSQVLANLKNALGVTELQEPVDVSAEELEGYVYRKSDIEDFEAGIVDAHNNLPK